MRLCIICEDKDVAEVRQKCKDFIPTKESMTKPLSPTGKLPATHWMCVCNVSEEIYQNIESKKDKVITTTAAPSLLLEELNLKKIETK